MQHAESQSTMNHSNKYVEVRSSGAPADSGVPPSLFHRSCPVAAASLASARHARRVLLIMVFHRHDEGG